MLTKDLLGGGRVTPPEGGIHFKASKAMSGVNFFDHNANQNYDFSSLEVYINDELTDIPANTLTADAGDDIKIVSRSKPYPFFYPSGKDYIASIEEPLPLMGETNFSNYFAGCAFLTSIPEGLFDNNPQVTNFSGCFSSCSSLTSIPQGLFNNNPNVTDFGYCFSYCAALTSIPQGLFDKNTNVTNFGSCFQYCRKLTVNVQIGSTATSVSVSSFAYRTAAKGTVYCRAGSAAYEAFSSTSSANVNVLTY